MRNNPSAIRGLYSSNEKYQHTFRDIFRMKDEIDGGALEKAVNTAVKRYPYFAIKLVKNDNEVIHRVVPNDSPVVVAHRTEPLVLCSEETNEHIFAILYDGKEIYVDMSHAFVDGTGAYEFSKTLLYYYITEKYGKTFPAGDIRTLDTPITEEEVGDPYLHLPPMIEKPVGGVRKAVPCFSLEDGGKITDRTYTVYKLRTKENVFIKYCRSNDGSPATMTAVFLAKAIFRLHDDLDKNVRISMAQNQRPYLGTPKAHHSLVGNIRLDYPMKVRDWSIEKLGTVSRSMVMLQSDPGNVLADLYKTKEFIDSLYAIDDMDTLKAASNKLYASAARYATALVSYVGKSDFGVLEDYIESHFSYIDPTYMNLAIEVAAANGCFCYTFMQDFADDIYVKAFVDELRKEGIEVEFGEAEPLIFPRINLWES